MKIYASMDELLAALDDAPDRSRLLTRFLRLAHWLSDSDTLSGLVLGLWGSAIAAVAAGDLPRHALWFPAAALLLISAYRLVTTAVHSATCPYLFTPAPWDQTPEDASEEVE